MSNKLITLVHSRRAGGAHRKSVLSYMADKASDDGRGVWCSKGTIARETEIARSTVFKIIGEFLAEGLIRAVGTHENKHGDTVEYTLMVASIEALEEVKQSPSQSATRTSSNTDQSERRTGSTQDIEPDAQDVGSPSAGPVRSTDPTSPSAGPQLVRQPDPNPLRTILEPPPIGPPPRKKGRKQSIPSDAVISEAFLKAAEDKGIGPEEAAAQFERFRDRAVSKGDAYVDWLAAWRNWLTSPFFKPILTGGKNERSDFGSRHRAFVRDRAQGKIDRGPDPRDPFAG